MKVNSALDGFGRFNRINFKDGEITLNSKMMNSTWYEMCEKAGKIIPGMTFVPTSPVNWESRIPFVNLYYTQHYYDNDWTQPNRLPDGKTYVGMTDMPAMLEFDIDSLTSKGTFQWKDDINCSLSTTHIQYLKSGEMFGVCGDVNPMGENHLIAFKVMPDDIHKRIPIATINVGKAPGYQHSFGLSDDYITIFQHSTYIDINKQMMGYPMIDCMTYDNTKMATIHVIKISDGSVQSIDAGIPFQMMHTGNQFMKDGKLIIDATTYDMP